jgi:short-subunit dehydrogenase
MPRFSTKDCSAVITGASSGLGAEFARQLAPHARALALVARREPEMANLAASLAKSHPNLRIAVIPCDLADPDARSQLPAHLASLGFRTNFLINNAGLGDYGEFASAPWHRVHDILKVNIETLTHLSHAFLPDLATAAPSAILNVSSLAGELPIPDFAVYAASKAYVSSFSEALRIELKSQRITVSAFAPGPIHTNFGQTARRTATEKPTQPEWSYVPADKAVASALAALRAGRARCTPGFIPATTARLINCLPRPLLRAILSLRPRRSP